MPKRFSIDDYFAKVRSHEEAPLVHSEQISLLLEQRTATQHKKRNSPTHRSWFVPSLSLGFTAAMLAVVVFWPSGTAQTERAIPALAHEQSLSAGQPLVPPLTANMPTYPDTTVVGNSDFAIEQRPVTRQTGAVASIAPSMVVRTASVVDKIHMSSIAQATTNTLRLHSVALATTAIVGPAFITLTKEHLALLGVLVENGKAFYYDKATPHFEHIAQQLRISAAQLAALLREQNINLDAYTPPVRVAIRTNGVGSTNEDSAKKKELSSSLASQEKLTPRIASIYHKGNLTATYWRKQDNAIVEKLRSEYKQLAQVRTDTSLNRLVPIHFQLKDEHNTWLPQADILLWYDASVELAEALPSPYREQLLTELRPTTNNPVVSGQQYFDSWRTTAGAITATTVYPNPATGDKAVLRYTLTEQRATTVALHDIFGRYITTIRSGEHPAGSYEVELPLRNMENGMYLVVLTTNNNEQAVQRLLLQR